MTRPPAHKVISPEIKMSTARASCLMVLSSAVEGVSAQSFVQAFSLASTNFTVQLASPSGKATEFVHQDENNRRWFNEFRSKANSTPICLDTIDANRYSAMLIPASPGALHDLLNNKDLAQIISQFVKDKKPICAIGQGVSALCGAKKEDNKTWSFEDYSLTAPSVHELARSPEFATLPIIIEDFIKDNGAGYSNSKPDAVHVIVDRHVITGQNVHSTLIAVQNLVLLCSQKQKSSSR